MAAAEALEEEMVGRSVGWVVGWMEAEKERREGNNQGANEERVRHPTSSIRTSVFPYQATISESV